LKEVSLAEFIADTNDIVKRLNPDKDVLVTVSLEMVPEKITIDTTLMQQALINILTNAYQFTPENGEIKIRVYLEDSQFVIAVQDSGPGISNEALPNIFEPFFSTRKENGGTGLGLAIAKKIVDRHSGRISAKNNYGNGSTFTITLPLQHCTVISSSKRDKQAA